MKKIALLPIDNRPVTYTLLKDIMALNDNIKLDMPERNYLGGLYEAANIKEITNWLIKTDDIDYLILSLDTIAYGGLVPSRRMNDGFDEIKSRLDIVRDSILEKKKKIKN